MIEIVPSLLSADFGALGAELQSALAERVARFHVDVMDGHFVPNLSMGPHVVRSLRPLMWRRSGRSRRLAPIAPSPARPCSKVQAASETSCAACGTPQEVREAKASKKGAQMRIGMVGLGRMGANMARRLLAAGHECVVYDVATEAVAALAKEGATAASSYADLARKLPAPRAVWLMVPAGLVQRALDELVPQLEPNDTVIDGGNSYYHDDLSRAQALEERNIRYVDVGVSGGVWGRERGYCLMIGGPKDAVERLEPIFAALAPGAAAAPRTHGRERRPSTAEQGYLHCGPVGAGHFVKMVHNGIEYGLMAAYAEGLNILRHANVGKHTHDLDAETTPLRQPELYQYDFDLAEVTELWRRGSVVQSWLLDLTAHALLEDPDLSSFAGRVSDSGEGRWTLAAAIDEGVPAPVLSMALSQRFASRGQQLFADQVLSALRAEFGGHVEKKS